MTILNAKCLNTRYLNTKYTIRLLLAFVCLGCLVQAFAQGLTPSQILQLTNDARAQARTCGSMSMPAAPPLRWNNILTGLAAGHSQDMADRDFFEHTNPDGQTPHARVEASSYPSLSGSAENIAYRFDTNHAGFLEDWLNSPGHCSNLMDPNWKDFGYGVAQASDGRVYATQMFASSFGDVAGNTAATAEVEATPPEARPFQPSDIDLTTPDAQPDQPSESAAITALNTTARGNEVNESLRAGFQPDPAEPLEFEVIAGGDQWIDDEDCFGYVADTPNATVEWLGGEGAATLSIYAVSVEDITLLINTPLGWVCSDNYLDPLVTLDNIVPGDYSIWIGVLGDDVEATLYISEYEIEDDF